jgi:hypothetical protein
MELARWEKDPGRAADWGFVFHPLKKANRLRIQIHIDPLVWADEYGTPPLGVCLGAGVGIVVIERDKEKGG